jgi:hypothetical protein
MSRATTGRSAMSKDVIPDEPYDPRVEHVKLVDLDLTDPVVFPQMIIDVFW